MINNLKMKNHFETKHNEVAANKNNSFNLFIEYYMGILVYLRYDICILENTLFSKIFIIPQTRYFLKFERNGYVLDIHK